ncbi:TetR family transcriptional regulator [Streptomyces sioyaensis]|uniref:TetR family transcriptional regulator n=1 Tax=Streptomyces sioyaensis TaxID=67364 RepID=UPI003D704D0C
MTRAEDRARARALLPDAAARVFAREGFTGASVEAIAESAGCSIGALYSNFSSEEALFL